ncbi:MAG: hypothetical protein Q4F30_08295 [Akkermansia sp.]|nr:hypothetical protein [Akkermansia sp.]
MSLPGIIKRSLCALLPAAVLLAPAAWADAWTLGEVAASFKPSHKFGNNVCFLLDGTRVAVIGTTDGKVAALLVYPGGSKNIEVLTKLQDKLEIDNAGAYPLVTGKKRTAAMVVDNLVAQQYAQASGGAFGKSLGESISYLVSRGDFIPAERQQDGSLVMKMVARSGMELVFPFTDGSVQVLEATGSSAKSMSTHKAEELAGLLGFDKGGRPVEKADSKRYSTLLDCKDVFYRNRNANISVVRTNKRKILLGREERIKRDDLGRKDLSGVWPDEECAWPEVKVTPAREDRGSADSDRHRRRNRDHEADSGTSPATTPVPDTMEQRETDTTPAPAVDTPQPMPTREEAMDDYLRFLQGL